MFLHFIWVSKTRAFGEGEYMSILSALKNTSYDIRLHTNLLEDTTKEWNPYDFLSKYSERFEIIYTTAYNEELYRETKMSHYNWITDMERIRILHEYGGMYSDLDMIWFKEFPEELIGESDFLITWENQSYKVVQNAWMYMKKGYQGGKEILDLQYKKLEEIKPKIIKTEKRTLKNVLIFFYIIGNYAKEKGMSILSKKFFFKNTGRRTGRALKRIGLPSKYETDFGSTNDKLDFNDICGYHYYSSLFDWSSIKQLPDLKEVLTKILQ
jgi:hypothetical protein